MSACIGKGGTGTAILSDDGTVQGFSCVNWTNVKIYAMGDSVEIWEQLGGLKVL